MIHDVDMDTENLIVGAGPCGVALAIELQRRNVPYTLIDQKTEVSPHSKALALFPRSLEILDAMGIVEDFLGHGRRIEGLRLYNKDEYVTGVNFSHLDTPYPFALFIPQNTIETLLRKRLQELGGAIHSGVQLIAYEDKRAVIEKDGQLEYWNPQYIMGCDGARSKVLDSLRIPCQRKIIQQPFTLFDLEFDQDVDQSHLCLFFHDDAMYPLFPFPDNRHFRIISTTSSNEHLEIPDKYYTILPPGTKVSRIIWSSSFQLHPRLASKMQDQNAFLLGDAVHSISPLGGQGLNTALQDAFNLGWKIADVHHKRASVCLLKTYHEERHPIAKGLFEATSGMTKLVANKHTWVKKLLFAVMTKLLQLRKFKAAMVNNLTELAVKYPSTGKRVPNVAFSDQSTLFMHLQKGHHVLISLGEEELPSHPQETIVIKEEGDAAKNLARQLHISVPGHLLIRPDGYSIVKADKWQKTYAS